MKTVTKLMNMKKKGDKITMLTCYDYSMAKLMDNAGVDTLLVGDSLGMTILGYEDTLSVTMEDMIHHTAAVARGAKNALVIGDMPFMSYQVSVEQAVINAGRLIKEGRAQMVKLCIHASYVLTHSSFGQCGTGCSSSHYGHSGGRRRWHIPG